MTFQGAAGLLRELYGEQMCDHGKMAAAFINLTTWWESCRSAACWIAA